MDGIAVNIGAHGPQQRLNSQQDEAMATTAGNELTSTAYDHPEGLEHSVNFHMQRVIGCGGDCAIVAKSILRNLTGYSYPESARQTMMVLGLSSLLEALTPWAEGLRGPGAPDMMEQPAAMPAYVAQASLIAGGGVYAQMLRTHEEACQSALQQAQSDARDDIREVRRLTTRRVRLSAVSPNAPVVPPRALRCPLSRELFYDPVLCTDGKTYERRRVPAHLQVFSTAYTMRALADVWRADGNKPIDVLGANLAAAVTCPLTQELCNDPVALSDGLTYDREACAAYLQTPQRERSPTHRQPLPVPRGPVDNIALREFVEQMAEDPRFTEFEPAASAPNQARRGAGLAQLEPGEAAAAAAEIEAFEQLARAFLGELLHPPQGYLADMNNVVLCLDQLAEMEQLRAERSWYSVRDNRQFSQLANRLLSIANEQLRTVPLEDLPVVTLYILGEVKRLTGDSRAAMEIYRILMALDPERFGAPVCGRAALVVLEVNQPEHAVALVRAALALDPENPHALAASGELLLRARDFVAARQHLELSLRLLPTREAKNSLRRVSGRRRGMQ